VPQAGRGTGSHRVPASRAQAREGGTRPRGSRAPAPGGEIRRPSARSAGLSRGWWPGRGWLAGRGTGTEAVPIREVPLRVVAAATAAVVVAVTGAVVALWPSSPAAARARGYQDVTACLLTDERGLAGQQAGAAWAGMQDASATSHARVQYVAALGPQSPSAARTYLAGLVQRRCTVILASGTAPTRAVTAVAATHLEIRFVTVGGTAHTSNLDAVPATGSAEIRHAIGSLVGEAVSAG